MGFLSLFAIASAPVLKVLLISAIGLFLGFDRVDILGENARHHLNKVVFYVLNPALVSSNLAKTVTFESFLTLWFMPVNILITFIIGSVLGWLVVKLTRAPKHLKGLIIGACSAGNLGNLPIIIIPAICHEKGSPFGAADVCESYGLSYASLSMAIGAIYIWSYAYNIVRVSSSEGGDKSDIKVANAETPGDFTEPLLPSVVSSPKTVIRFSQRIKEGLRNFLERINLKAILSPSTLGAIVGFVVGMIPFLRKSLIGSGAPLHVVQDSAYMLGTAAIPAVTLILGANLLRGLKGSKIQLSIVIGIVAVRYIFLPLLGILIVKGAVRIGVAHNDPLFLFVLLLQYALPPAMSIGTMTQLFGAGQNECSVIMLWTYALASVALTLWCTFFLWLVA